MSGPASTRTRFFCTVALVIGLLVAGIPASPGAEESWHPFDALVGTWQGVSEGCGLVSDVTHEWGTVLGGRFLQLRTRSQPRPESGEAPPHEDIGFLSRDAENDRFVFRQFHTEGFVNTYEVNIQAGEKLALVFDFREVENGGGMQARLRLNFTAADEYEMALDLAPPGKDFSPYQQMTMKKVQ